MFKIAASLLSLGLFVLCSGAAAQWAWKDAKGTTVYSDQPPPADIKPSQFLKQPGTGGFAPASAAPSEAAERSPAKTAAQMDAEFRKRQTEKAEAEKKAADIARAEQQRSDQCLRTRNSLQALQDGYRVRSSTTGGVMEDAERATEIARLQKLVAEGCK